VKRRVKMVTRRREEKPKRVSEEKDMLRESCKKRKFSVYPIKLRGRGRSVGERSEALRRTQVPRGGVRERSRKVDRFWVVNSEERPAGATIYSDETWKIQEEKAASKRKGKKGEGEVRLAEGMGNLGGAVGAWTVGKGKGK